MLAHVGAARDSRLLAQMTLRGLPDDATPDLAVYGRSSEGYPAPRGMRKIELPDLTGGVLQRLATALRFARRIRRRRYRTVLILQSGIRHHNARGLLMGMAAAVSAGSICVADPDAPALAARASRVRGAFDGLVWAGLRVLGKPTASVLATIVGTVGIRVDRRTTGWTAGCPGVSPATDVVYLRTDLELASNDVLIGGSAAHTDGILRAFSRRGARVTYWSTGYIAGLPDDLTQASLRRVLWANVPRELAELGSGFVQGFAPPVGRGTLVYQRYSLNNLAGVILARRWRVPFILEANSSEAKWRHDAGALAYPRLAEACERLILRAADRIVAVSENAASELRTAGADTERLCVVPNGVEVARFADAPPRRLPFPAGSLVIGFVGLFYPWHGVMGLARAFARVHRERPESRLLMIGDGEQWPHVRAVLEEDGLLDAVLLTGSVPREDVPGYLASMDIAVAPHVDIPGFIGSPVKIFEYMASGRAIVATRVGQMAELLRDGETALLVPPDDDGRLCDALHELMDASDLRERLGREAQDEARSRHSWDARLEAILEPPEQ